ncbi:hypothetical protein AB3X94_37315 [Paraburkholderia sp. BR10923]|uniref:hypothetical protein n=1 Tax=Paraburkholderia sp. BR10923 TaxID=3236992 RepID=UPI0034CF395B
MRALLLCGVPLANICQHVINPESGRPVTYNTLVRAFKKEIAISVEHCTARVAWNLYRIATTERESAPVVSAATFYLRSRAGWKLSDAEGVPPRDSDATPMVENEETARAIIEDELEKYGRKRLTG